MSSFYERVRKADAVEGHAFRAAGRPQLPSPFRLQYATDAHSPSIGDVASLGSKCNLALLCSDGGERRQFLGHSLAPAVGTHNPTLFQFCNMKIPGEFLLAILTEKDILAHGRSPATSPRPSVSARKYSAVPSSMFHHSPSKSIHLFPFTVQRSLGGSLEIPQKLGAPCLASETWESTGPHPENHLCTFDHL